MPDHDLHQMTQKLLAFRAERDWEQFHNPKDQIVSLCLEASEVLELTQWKQGDALAAHLAANKEQLSDELADVLGWVLLIAHDQGIELSTAFTNKLLKNAQKYPADQSRGRADKYTAYHEQQPPQDQKTKPE